MCLRLVWTLLPWKSRKPPNYAIAINPFVTRPPWEDRSESYEDNWSRYVKATGPSPLQESEEGRLMLKYSAGLWKARLRWWDGHVARVFAVLYCRNQLPVHVPKDVIKLVLQMIKQGRSLCLGLLVIRHNANAHRKAVESRRVHVR